MVTGRVLGACPGELLLAHGYDVAEGDNRKRKMMDQKNQAWPPPPILTLPPQPTPAQKGDWRSITIGLAANFLAVLISLWETASRTPMRYPFVHSLPHVTFTLVHVKGMLFIEWNWYCLVFMIPALVGLGYALHGLWNHWLVKPNKGAGLCITGLLLNLVPFIIWRIVFFMWVRE